MICSRCGKSLDVEKQRRNAEYYGENIYACPHCGKPYRFIRKVIVQELQPNCGWKEDDWGNEIVNDEKYNKKT